MSGFTRPRRRRRTSLTPMIDVVFLLLVFFMLAARFGLEGGVALSLAGDGAPWSGPPRLVEVAPGTLRLNGVPLEMEALLAELRRLGAAGVPVVLRAGPEADLGRLVEVMERLREAGFADLVLVE